MSKLKGIFFLNYVSTCIPILKFPVNKIQCRPKQKDTVSLIIKHKRFKTHNLLILLFLLKAQSL